MKNRLLATVLTLALLCPMLSFLMVPDANAALEVDDGVSLTSSSNILNEEWNFDDMSEGEVLTGGYVSSHANGNFTYAAKATNSLVQPEKFTAVSDTENGGSYIYADNAFLAFEDHDLLLLRNTYEISWRLKVDAIGSNTTLLWWASQESADDRNCLLRYNNNGALGYTVDNSYTSTVTTSVNAPLGEWHSYRARISPLDGRMWLWLDGENVLNGVVNEYLRDNAKNAENSIIGVFFAWGGSGMKTAIDDIKITGVTVDEHLTFDRPTAGEAFSASWDFDATPASTDKVTVSAGSGYTLGVVEKDTENTTSMMNVVQSGGNYDGPLFALAGKASDYGKVTFSWKMKYDDADNYTNIFRIVKSDGSEANLFRVTGLTTSATDSTQKVVKAELFKNGGTNAGTLKQGAWNDFKVTIYPNASKITVNINGTITQLNTDDTVTSILQGLRENDKALAVRMFALRGPVVEFYIDDISIEAEPVVYGGEELLDFEGLTAGSTVNDSVLKDMITGGLFSLTTDGGGSMKVAADPSDTSNKVLYNINKRMYLDFLMPTSAFEKLKLSFDVRFEGMGGFTSFMSSYACGAQGNFLRIKSETNALQNAGDSQVIATLTQGTDAKWYNFSMDIVASTGAVALTVTERDSGTSVGTYSWTDSNIKSSYTGGEALGFRMHYCWDSTFKVYFDNIYAKASVSPVETVNSGWKDQSFTMTTTPDIANMANDDWEIATDPILLTPPLEASWDFNDGTLATKNDITVTAGTNYSFAADSTDADNSTNVLSINWPTTKKEVKGPKFALPGTVNDYDTITFKFKMRLDYASGWVNLFRFCYGDNNGSTQNLIRIEKMTNSVGSTVELDYLGDNLGNDGTAAGEHPGILTYATWSDFTIIIKPAENKITTVIDGKKVELNGSAKMESVFNDLINNDRALVFMLYHQWSGIMSELYFDDVSISATPKLDYDENDVLKTVTDSEGNTRGIFVIQDKEKYLTNQPFELSFDYMMNQKPSGHLNFVKMKMTGTSFAVFRLDPNGKITNYTSAGYVSSTATSGANLDLNVASKTLTAGIWYNFRIVFDPNSGHVMGYVDNVLLCDYNINDVYIDTNGNPLGVTENPDRMYIELASQYSASAIKTNDSCFDNVRIRTLNYNEYTKTYLSDSDFDSAATGELTADKFSKYTGLYTKSIGGTFAVAGSDMGKYVTATVKEGEGVAIDMTNGYAPLAADVVAFEGNFTFTSFGTDGKLNIYSLGRGESGAVSLLSVDNSGKLYLGSLETSKTLNANEIYQIKLIFSGISGTGELFVNGEFVAAAPIIAQAELPTLTYTDGMGNTVSIGNKKFLTTQSTEVKTLSGVMLQSAEMPDPAKVAFPEDTLTLLGAEGSGTWDVIFDDLTVYRDERAYIYSDNQSSALAFNDASGRLWGTGFVAEFVYDGNPTDITSLAEWTVGGSATALIKAGDGKLYAADGTTELATLEGETSDIAVAVTSNYWESHVKANNYVIKATAYVNGSAVGTYTVLNTAATSSGALTLADGASDVKLYFGNAIRDNRAPVDASGVKFEGYNAFAVTFENETFFDNAEANAINYVEWAFPNRGKTIVDMEGATVKLAEHVIGEDNSFFRLRRPEIENKPTAYMEYNLGAMGEYAALYSVQMELRYTDNIASSLDIATAYEKNMAGKLTLLSVDYQGRFYFENNGVR